MTRSIPKGMAGLLARLELDRPELVTMSDMESLVAEEGIATPARIVASRLRERGWLLSTPQRGVWEFVPAEMAGAFTSADPLMAVKAFRRANPGVECALAHQSAAWALGLADRVPARTEVAFAERPHVKVPGGIASSTYRPNLPLRQAKGAPVLPPEAIVVHMTQRPSAVRSWRSAGEWLPDVAYELAADDLLEELRGRPASVWARTGYLLQGLRPDVAEEIGRRFSPAAKVRFGTSRATLRNDERWKVADALLPFDPRKLEAVR